MSKPSASQPKRSLRLSVVIPVLNEEATVEKCIRKVVQVCEEEAIPLDLIAVDDGSTDQTPAILARLATELPNLQVLVHEKNQGKGGALRTGFAEVRGDIVLVQDADLEYDPKDFPALLVPFSEQNADVVYGSRFLGGKGGRAHLYLNYLANRWLTTMSNLFTNLNLTDMETGYKVMRREVIENMTLKSNGFSIEPEMTAKISKMKARIFEVPISYNGRDFTEGKKIRWTDGFSAVWAIVKYNLFSRKGLRLKRPGAE